MKPNRNIIGAILLLFGLASLFQIFVVINVFWFAVFCIGCAFLTLYATKKKSWALLLGAYTASAAAYALITDFFNVKASFGDICIAFFLVQGAIFLVLFFAKNKSGLLYPGAFLSWMGFFFFLGRVNGGSSFMMFLLCLGLAFLTIYILGRDYVSFGVGMAGIILIAIGLLRFISSRIFSGGPLKTVFALIIIVFALFMIFGKNKSN
jgi:hypothetical protein